MKRPSTQRIAMLGVEGAGMSGLAVLLAARGATIFGVDRAAGQLTWPDSSLDIPIVAEEAAGGVVAAADLVIHTDAINSNHPLLRIAADNKVRILAYHQALGELTQQMRTLAVTGTHGKSSTTSMLAHIFISAGFDPSALVGAPVPAWGNKHARVGSGNYFIVEADEYRNHFHALRVESAIITTIDFDHPDFFSTLDDVVASFSQFVGQVAATGVLVIPQTIINAFPNIPWPAHTLAIAPPTTPIELVLPGTHMQYNAWLAIQLAGHYQIDEETSRQALRRYSGLGRRFELLGTIGTMDVVSDYGHHPREIAATLRAAREQYGLARICVIFEAHTRERLQHFGDQFRDALALADAIVIAPVFTPPGREGDMADVGEPLLRLQRELRNLNKDVYRADTLTELSRLIPSLTPDFKLVLAFSAGNVDRYLRSFVNRR